MIRLNVLVFLLVVTGCAGLQEYDITLNERVVYSPRPLAVDPGITDPALAACVGQTLADQRPSRAAGLDVLICTNAGISHLDGIAAYTGLRQVKFSDNAISDATPLNDLPELRYLDLRGNDGLDCNSIIDLTEIEHYLPEHCAS